MQYIYNPLSGKFDAVWGNHAASHIRAGSDEVDGDKLDIDWNPSNYTPATTPSEVDNVDHLTAHLYGIDQALASLDGAWELLEDYTFASQGTYHTLSGLDGDTDIIYAVFLYIVENGVTSSAWLQPNADSNTANYDHQHGGWKGGSSFSEWKTARPGLWCGFIEDGSHCGWSPAMYLYAPQGGYRMWHGYAHTDYLPSSSTGNWRSVISRYKVTNTNITSLKLTATNANMFGAGSRVIFFKIT